ncbi:MAG: LysM peptidoglycan-binding domain-containing protein [Chloroflexota bacterium]
MAGVRAGGSLSSLPMDGRGPSNGRNRGGRSSTRLSGKRGSAFARSEHRRPVYGGQVRRDNRRGAYTIGFIVIVAALAGFVYVALSWATGSGRAGALATQPTPTLVAVVSAATSTPSADLGEQTYVVQSGDYPEKIAQKFGIKTEELIAANTIEDPQKLQIGQTLKIPPPSAER